MRIFKRLSEIIENLFKPGDKVYKICTLDIDDQQHQHVANHIGLDKAELPKKLASFMHASSGFIRNVRHDTFLTKEDCEKTLILIAKGMLSASRKFKVAIPEIYLNSGYGLLMVMEEKSARIEIGEGAVRMYSYNQFINQTGICNHATHTKLDFGQISYIAGFEEIVHTHNLAIDPENMALWGKATIRGNFETRVRDYYCKNPAEIYAGFHVREEIRNITLGNEQIELETFRTDMFMIKLYQSGKLGQLPEYMEKAINEAEGKIRARYGKEMVEPLAPIGMSCSILEAEPESFKWRSLHKEKSVASTKMAQNAVFTKA